MLPKENRAAVFNGPRSITMERLPLVKSNDGSAILKILSCAVCGYDVRVYNEGHRKVHPPIILGHEICAETIHPISNLGNGNLISEGTRVAISPLVPCLKCYYCASERYNLCNNLQEIGSSVNGGFAEYIKIPLNNIIIDGIVPIPDNITNEEAALIEPLACCLNAHLRFKSSHTDRSIIIIGDGPIGLIHLQISKLYGIKTIVIGKIDYRMDQAKQLGADVVLLNSNIEDSVHSIMDSTNNVGANMIIVATSNPDALDLALRIASKDSIISLFAGMPRTKILSLDPNWLHYNEISISGSFSSTPILMRKAISMVSESKINLKKIISCTYRLKNIEDAFFATEKYSSFRSIIHPSE
jgi:L-iditol 2-dehydrogenase